MSDIYNDGTYLSNNPTWHSEDSAWKAGQIARIIEKNGLTPKTVGEIGCGAGMVLDSLSRMINEDAKFLGFEISRQAYEICTKLDNERIQFSKDDFFGSDIFFDVALCIDVFEHVEDYFGFLRKFKKKARHKIFHIPLEISAQSALRKKLFIHNRKAVGHLHLFTKDTALATLEDTGYSIIDYFYTGTSTDMPSKSFKQAIAKFPRKLLFGISKDFAVRLLGGYSLMVLAE